MALLHDPAVRTSVEARLGRLQPSTKPRPLLKFMVLNLPWVKSAPTHPAFRPGRQYDFAEQLARCRGLIAEFTGKSIEDLASEHPAFGAMSGRDQSRLHARHLDHHLRQFGV